MKSQKKNRKRQSSRAKMLFADPIASSVVDRAILHLRHDTGRKPRGHCLQGNTFYCRSKRNSAVWLEDGLKGRNANYIADEIRKALLKHDWDSAARLLPILVNTGARRFSSFVVKVGTVLAMNHPESTKEDIDKFIGAMTDYSEQQDIDKCLAVINTVRQQLPPTTDRNWKQTFRKAEKLVDDLQFLQLGQPNDEKFKIDYKEEDEDCQQGSEEN